MKTNEKTEKQFFIESCPCVHEWFQDHFMKRQPVELTGRFETEMERRWTGGHPKPPRGPSASLHVVLNVMEVESGGSPGKLLQKWCFNGYVQGGNYAGKKIRGYIDFSNRHGVAQISLTEGTPQPRR